MKVHEFNELLVELALLHEAAGRPDIAEALRSLTKVFKERENLSIDEAVKAIRRARVAAAA